MENFKKIKEYFQYVSGWLKTNTIEKSNLCYLYNFKSTEKNNNIIDIKIPLLATQISATEYNETGKPQSVEVMKLQGLFENNDNMVLSKKPPSW